MLGLQACTIRPTFCSAVTETQCPVHIRQPPHQLRCIPALQKLKGSKMLALKSSISAKFLFVPSSGGGTSLEYPATLSEVTTDRSSPRSGQTNSPQAPPQDENPIEASCMPGTPAGTRVLCTWAPMNRLSHTREHRVTDVILLEPSHSAQETPEHWHAWSSLGFSQNKHILCPSLGTEER